MAFDDITTRLNLVAGDTSAIAATERNEKALDELTGAVSRTDKKFVDLGKTQRSSFELSKKLAESAVRDFKAQLDAMEEYEALLLDVRSATQSFGDVTEKANTKALVSGQKTLSVIERYDDAFKQASDRSSAFGDVGTSASTLSGAARGLGLGGVGEAGLLAADIFDSVEALERGKVAFRGFADIIGSGETLLGGLGLAFRDALPSISSTTAGVLALSTAAAGVLAFVGAIGVFNQQLQTSAQLVQETTNRYIAERDARRELRDDQLGTIELEQRLAEARQAAADAQADIDKAALVRQQAFSTAQSQSSFDPFDLNAKLVFGLTESAGAFKVLDEDAQRANQALIDANAQIEVYTQALADGTAATNDAANATIESAKEQADAEKALATTRLSAAQALADLEKQEADLITQYNQTIALRREDLALQAQREAEDAAIRERRARQDLEAAQAERLQTQNDRIAGILTQGAQQLANIQQSIVDKQVDAAAQTLQIQLDLNAAQATAQANFARDELRRIEDFNLKRTQSERRFRDSLDRASLDNDIEALINLRRNRNLQRREENENFTAETRRRNEDYEAERQARERATQDRIAQINTETAAFTAAQQERARVEQQLLNQRVETETKAFNDQLAKDEQRRQLQAQREAEDATRRQQRQDADNARQEARQLAALNQRLALIDTEQVKQLALINSTSAAATLARTNELAFLTLIAQKSTALLGALNTNTVGTNTTTAAGGWSSVTTALGLLGLPLVGAFANGGVVPKGRRGMGLFEGVETEYVFTETQLKNPVMRQALGGVGGSAANINLNLTIPNVNVGELITPSQARDIATQIGNGLQTRVLKIVKDGIRMAKQVGA